jgi:transcriptional regulator with XRE-family HTH domain
LGVILAHRNKEEVDVKAIREKLGLTQTRLASLLGVTKGAVSQWESGFTSPSITAVYMMKGLLKEQEAKKDILQEGKPADLVVEVRLTGDEKIIQTISLILNGLLK